MSKLRKLVRQILLEACEDGNKFDTTTGMPCTTNPQHWQQYMQNQQEEQQKRFDQMMGTFQKGMDQIEDANNDLQDEIDQKAEEDRKWRAARAEYEELDKKVKAKKRQYVKAYNDRMDIFNKLSTGIAEYGMWRPADWHNRMLAKRIKQGFAEPIDEPVTLGMHMGWVIVAELKMFRTDFYGEMKSIGDFYHKKYMKALDKLTIEKAVAIHEARMGDLVKTMDRMLKQMDKNIEVCKKLVAQAKEEGKGWYLKPETKPDEG